MTNATQQEYKAASKLATEIYEIACEAIKANEMETARVLTDEWYRLSKKSIEMIKVETGERFWA